MSFGRITGHLMAARELAQHHDSATDSERFFVEVILMHIDLLLAITRAAHHRRTLCGGA